jgi:hypothetical protein
VKTQSEKNSDYKAAELILFTAQLITFLNMVAEMFDDTPRSKDLNYCTFKS